ncbi:MAG: VWA domain-containing protein [Phycisphaerae bacterium]|nr:VWA domain-containing protein [Phycisphaerae bacterium]MCZ2399383.1 VWA domain-containing protein [Phycisphaerae bacterium]
MQRFRAGGRFRRAGVTVQVALAVTFVVGFAALSVDMGSIYVAKAELQRAADAAAMAAATNLMQSDTAGYEENAKQAAGEIAELNSVLGKYASLNLNSDVELGKAVLNPSTGRYEFSAGMQPFDAVQVTVRRTEGSSGGPINLGFAGLFGMNTKNLEATATAMLIPRDMAVVIDLSGSMNYDSQTMYYKRTDGGYPNTRDIWCALDGPSPSRPYIPGPENATEYAGDTGPVIGVMGEWGNPLLGGYKPSTDPGLWLVQKGATTTQAAIVNSLTARGYNFAERTALLSGSKDSNTGHWQRRCGVCIGLASWKSGKSGGFPGGNGDDVLDAGEVTWLPTPSYQVSWGWTNYVDFVQGSTRGDFRYRYGPKAFVDFLLNSERRYADTNNLWDTPAMPMVAIKDAVQTMVDVISAEDTLDHISLHVFGTDAKDEVLLTANLQSVADTLYERQAAHYNPNTNIGEGLRLGIMELESARARPNARKMIVLMSDGVPNVGENGKSGEANGIAWAYAQAEKARDKNISIVCISVGYGVDRTIMQQIATIANGQEYYAAGNPEEYTEQLQAIFRTLGGKRPVALVE